MAAGGDDGPARPAGARSAARDVAYAGAAATFQERLALYSRPTGTGSPYSRELPGGALPLCAHSFPKFRPELFFSVLTYVTWIAVPRYHHICTSVHKCVTPSESCSSDPSKPSILSHSCEHKNHIFDLHCIRAARIEGKKREINFEATDSRSRIVYEPAH